jgi:hypothetical protein
VAVFEQAIVMALYADTLDGGATGRRCGAVAIIFWVFWMVIIIRRGTKPTLTDLLYTYLGYPILLLAVEVGNAYRY